MNKSDQYSYGINSSIMRKQIKEKFKTIKGFSEASNIPISTINGVLQRGSCNQTTIDLLLKYGLDGRIMYVTISE